MVSSLSARKKVAAVVLSTPSLVMERLPYHQRPYWPASRTKSARFAIIKEGSEDSRRRRAA